MLWLNYSQGLILLLPAPLPPSGKKTATNIGEVLKRPVDIPGLEVVEMVVEICEELCG